MINFRKFISMSAVAVLGVTNLLTPLSYANAASPLYDDLTTAQLKESMLKFMMPDKDVYLKAYAEANKYDVVYHGNTGAIGTMATGHFEYDTTGHLAPNAYTKTGYTWNSWNSDAGGAGTSHASGATVYNWTTEDGVTIPIYAQWTANHYNITYSLNDAGGSSTGSLGTRAPTSGTYDVDVNIDHPSRQGYDFSGWNITNMNAETNLINNVASNATSVNYEESTLYKNLRTDDDVAVNFEATWTAKLTEYIVNHFTELLSGGYSLDPTKTTTGSAPTDTTATGALETFPGFTAPDEASTTVTADGQATINYQYTRNLVDLNLNAGRGIASVTATGQYSTPDLTTTSSATGSFKYQDPITLAFEYKDGYENGSWTGSDNSSADVFNMPLTSLSKTASATPIVYNIVYQYKGADYEPSNPATYTVESGVVNISDPSRQHSKFAGWIGGVNGGAQLSTGTTPLSFGPNATGHRTYTATWTCVSGFYLSSDTTKCLPNADTEYHVEHYFQKLTGSGYDFDPEQTTTQTGETLQNTDAKPIAHEGFEVQEIHNQQITGDGSTVIQIRYDRLNYNTTVTPTSGVTVTHVGQYDDKNGNAHPHHQYGDTVTITATTGAGYTFNGWEVKDASGNAVTTVVDANALSTTFKMPASAVTIKANTTANTYTITMDPNGGTISGGNTITYTVQSDTFNLPTPTRDNSIFSGWKGTSGTATPATTNPLTIEEGSVGDRRYEAEWRCETGYTLGDDKCVANVYKVVVDTMDNENGNVTNPEEKTFTYDSGVTIPNPTQSGYTFAGWTVSGYDPDTATVGDNDPLESPTSGTVFKNLTPTSGATVTLTANWIADTDTQYVVYHYTKNLEGDGYTLARTDSDLSGTTNATLTLSELTGTFVGFEYTGGYLDGTTSGPIGDKATTTVIKKDGTTEIHLYYTRKKHHVYLSGQNINTLTGEGDYDFEQEVTVTATPKTGYHFVEWKKKTDGTFELDL